MIAQVRLHRNVIGHQWNGVLIRVLAAAQLGRQLFARLYVTALAFRRVRGRRSGCGRRVILLQVLAPTSFDVLTVVAIAHAMAREVVEQVSGRWLVYVGNVFVKRNDVADGALGVIFALVTAICEGPRFLVVVGS